MRQGKEKGKQEKGVRRDGGEGRSKKRSQKPLYGRN